MVKKKTNTKALLCEMKENVRKVDSSITFRLLYDSRENVVTLLLVFIVFTMYSLPNPVNFEM